MDTGSVTLPLEVLKQQICLACGGYLSVGTVKVSPEGDAVCGRSNCLLFIKGESEDSLYNIVAAACLYRCSYHYSGCDALLTFKDVDDHEKQCTFARLYECPFCYFQGHGCQLVNHFGKTHKTYMPTEDVFRKILLYKDLNKHVGAIVKMSTLKLRRFVGHAPKICLAICNNCGIRIPRKDDIYFCTKYHIACNVCCRKKCIKCNKFQRWTKNSVFDEILIKCEWQGCSERKNFFEYLWHKQTCNERLYKCPCSSCEYTSFLDDIRQHWHLSPIVEHNCIQIVPGESRYWLPPLYCEIVYVAFEIDCEGDGVITLNNEHNVLPVCVRVNIIDLFGIKSWLKSYPSNSLVECGKIKCFKIEGFEKNDYARVILEALR